MAESLAFDLSCKVLDAAASPAIMKAYEKGLSIWEAKDDLAKLQVTIQTIQAVLHDAEKRQHDGSDAVKDWMKRLKGVLYDADDLFDEVATDDLLKQQLKKERLKKENKKRFMETQGWVSSINLNPITSRNSIAKKVKAITESLHHISVDMAQFKFELCLQKELISGVRREQDPGSLVDTKNLIGRDEDKKAILQMLEKESDNVPVVIAIVGIGGMGKTALAELIYDDDKIKATFEKRWFACIFEISDQKEVMEKICQSISEGNYSSCTALQLKAKIGKSIADKKFLLVLDDVWDDDRASWLDRISLLQGGAKGSKIIVTTRSASVAKAVGALEIHNLEGLSEDDSFDLFKRVAFAQGDENDPTRIDLAREIVKKCRNVPLAIRNIGSLLYEKHTVQEWESFKHQELSKLGDRDPTMSVLKLSYHHLPSNLKHCFAYCSLFPKGYLFDVRELIYLWISQGYIKPNHDWETLEQAGYSDFMYLLRRGFFQDQLKVGRLGMDWCKMHDLIHDLALHVAGNESNILKCTSSSGSNCARHVSIHYSIKNTWVIPTHWHSGNKLLSLLCMTPGSMSSSTVGQICDDFKLLRSLDLGMMGIENVPRCIGEMKHLRYLDLSGNCFESLPDSMTNLLNLLKLSLTYCLKLKALPDNFRKLINLRCLNIEGCVELEHMPAGLGELTCLQYLSHFHVGKAASEEGGVKKNGLDEFAGLKLRDTVAIRFFNDWDGDECNWQLPQSLEELRILDYPGKRIPDWGMNGRTNSLASLQLCGCTNVINLSPLGCLANLRSLVLCDLLELEFMEGESQSSCIAVEESSFFPRLEYLELEALPKLKGWWGQPATSTPSFPLLHKLAIISCPKLKSFPPCPRLQEITIRNTGGNMVLEQMLSGPASTIPPSSSSSSSPSSSCLQGMLISPCLQQLHFRECDSMEMLHVPTPQLRHLNIYSCSRLKKVHIANPNALEVLEIGPSCKELELWEEDKRGVDWDSLSNLSILRVHPVPPPEKLPKCLRHRQALGQLQISPSLEP